MTAPVDYAEIERLAKAATSGEWSHEATSFNKLDRILYAGRTGDRHGLNLMTLSDGDWNHVNNTNYIAAVSPATILRICEDVAKLRAALISVTNFEPQLGRDFGEETNFATAIAIARAALKETGQ